MKRLILVRHATATPEKFPQKDFDRQLEAIGRKEAEKLGKFMVEKSEKPGVIFSSSAIRTKETSEIIASILGLISSDIQFDLKLYNAGFQSIVTKIQQVNDEYESIVLVAHNPGISQAATALSFKDAYQMPPGSAVCLDFAIASWLELKAATGSENWYFIPNL